MNPKPTMNPKSTLIRGFFKNKLALFFTAFLLIGSVVGGLIYYSSSQQDDKSASASEPTAPQLPTIGEVVSFPEDPPTPVSSSPTLSSIATTSNFIPATSSSSPSSIASQSSSSDSAIPTPPPLPTSSTPESSVSSSNSSTSSNTDLPSDPANPLNSSSTGANDSDNCTQTNPCAIFEENISFTPTLKDRKVFGQGIGGDSSKGDLKLKISGDSRLNGGVCNFRYKFYGSKTTPENSIYSTLTPSNIPYQPNTGCEVTIPKNSQSDYIVYFEIKVQKDQKYYQTNYAYVFSIGALSIVTISGEAVN